MPTPDNKYILNTISLNRNFGGLTALADIDLRIKYRTIMGLIGPNGAGKTTLFNVLTGHYQPSSGQIYFKSEQISNLKPYAITKKGISRTFQNIRLFNQMSVLDNVLIGHHCRTSTGLMGALLRLPSNMREEKQAKEEAMSLLAFVNLQDKRNEWAANLSYGDQRRLEIARALAADPDLLLLDEPAAGMNPQETVNLMSLISRIREKMDKTVLLIEHDMKVVMGISEWIAVLDYGKMIAEGKPYEIRHNAEVIRAYLGDTA